MFWFYLVKNKYLITKCRSLKKFKVHLDSKTHLNWENVCFFEWIESDTPLIMLIQLSTEKHTKPTLCNCNFTPQRQYFETFVHRNPLIRDEILFLALFRGADQVYFLRYKHTNHFSAVACRPLHQKRLGQEFMRLQSTHIRNQTFLDTLSNFW